MIRLFRYLPRSRVLIFGSLAEFVGEGPFQTLRRSTGASSLFRVFCRTIFSGKMEQRRGTRTSFCDLHNLPVPNEP